MFCKNKVFLRIKQNSQENTYVGVFFIDKVARLRSWGLQLYQKKKKKKSTQVFSSEFC